MDFMHVIEPRGIAGEICIFWRNNDHVLLNTWTFFLLRLAFLMGKRIPNGGYWQYMRVRMKKRKEKKKGTIEDVV